MTRIFGDDSNSWELEQLWLEDLQSPDGIFTYMFGSWAGMVEGQGQMGLSYRAPTCGLFSITVSGQLYSQGGSGLQEQECS